MGGTVTLPAWELFTALGVLGLALCVGIAFFFGWRAGRRRGGEVARSLMRHAHDTLRAANDHRHTFVHKREE